MDIIGKIRRLTRVIFAANGNEVNLEPTDDAGMAATGDVTFTLPVESGTSHEITTNDSDQTLTNKSIDADENTISNLEDEDIKVGAAINAEKIHDGSVDNTEFGYLDGVTAPIQGQIDSNTTLITDHINDPDGAHAASAISYDNTSSGLTADEVQSAIDEVDLTLDTHIADTNIHYPQTAIDHTNLLNIGVNTHDQIDAHIAATAAHGVDEVMGTSGSTLQTVTYGVADDASDDAEIDLVPVQILTRLTGLTAERNLRGIDSTNTGVVIISNDTAQTLVVKNEDTGAVAATRILTGNGRDLKIKAGASVSAVYDTTEQRWRVIGGAGSGGALTTEDLAGAGDLETSIHYLSNTSGGSFSVNLPAGEAEAVIRITDATETWGDNALTVVPAAGESVDGGAADESLDLDVKGTWIQFMWDDAQGKWVSDDIFSGMRDGTTTVKIPKAHDYIDANINLSRFQGFGTVSNISIDFSRSGSKLFMRGRFTTGTTQAIEGRIPLPLGLTIGGSLSDLTPVGNLGPDAATTSRYYVHATKGDTFLNIDYASGASQSALGRENGNILTSNVPNAFFTTAIPIAEWEGDNAYEEIIISSGEGGTGGGDYNYIANPYAEIDTTGHTVSTTTGSFSVARTTTEAELPSINPAAWALSGSGVTAGDYVAIESKRAIANADTAVGTFEVSVVDVNGSLASDWKAQLYDADNSQYVGSEIEFQGTGTYPADAFTQPGVTYEIHMIAKVASPALVAAEFALRSETTLLSSYVGPWQERTPLIDDWTANAGVGLDASNSFFMIRVNGQSLDVKFHYQFTGTGSSGSGFFLKIDDILAEFGYTSIDNIPQFTNTPANYSSTLGSRSTAFYYNAGTLSVYIDGNSGNALNGNSFGASTTYISRIGTELSIRVAELANNVTPTITEKLYDNARCAYTKDNAQSFQNNLTTVIKYNTATSPDTTQGQYNSSTGVFTSSVDQTISFSAGIRFGTVGVTIAARKNGVIVRRVQTGGNSETSINGDIYLESGDTLDFTATNFVNGDQNSTNTIYNWLTLSRVPDTTGRAAGLLYADENNYGLVKLSTKSYSLVSTGGGSNLNNYLPLTGLSQTIEESGFYDVSYLIRQTAGPSGKVAPHVNGVVVSALQIVSAGSLSTTGQRGIVYLNAGDVIDLRAGRAGGSGSAAWGHPSTLSITKLLK